MQINSKDCKSSQRRVLFFTRKLLIPAIKIVYSHNNFFSFHLAHVKILGSTDCGKTICDFFTRQCEKLNQKKDYDEYFSDKIGIEIKSQHWIGNRKLSTEDILLEFSFPNTDNLGSKG